MAGQSNTIQISYEQLSQGKYVRTGDDLSITTENLWGDSETVLLKNYFITSPDLVTAKGSTLKGNIVNLLAVDSQPNTSNVAFEDPQAIGKITTADSVVVVQRADQFIELQKGDFIYLNDVVDAANGAVGISFKDESSISVDPGAKMVIDDFVYDPAEPTTGSMNANIITGNFSFISGQIAKTGNDAMQVTTPVLTIGVRGTQVAGKANQDGEENEIVLLPNEDGTVGQVMITNQSGSVLLTEAFQATTIATALQPPTVPVILPKEIVLKKFAKTIATTKKTKKVRETEKEAEEAAKEKIEAEEEKEQLEEEKEELEEEAEELEEEKEQLEEEAEALEEEAEALEEEKEQIEEEAELVEQEKEQVEEKAEALEEKAEELEKKLEEVPIEEKEQIEKELEAIEEEIQEVEEIKEEIEQKVQEVEEKIQEVAEKEQIIVDKAVEIEQQVKEVEQQVQIVEEKFVEVEQQFVVIEEKIIQVEQKFEQIEQDFEQFQQEFVQEFKEFIPEEELQQFVNEAPIEIIQDVQEMIREDIKNNPEIFDQEPEEEIIDEDPFQEVPEEDVILLDPEQDFDQMKEEFEQFVEENPDEVPEEIQDVFAEADNMEEFNEEMDQLMQDEEFIQRMEEEMPVQDDVFKEEPQIREEQPILVENDIKLEDEINYDYKEDDILLAFEDDLQAFVEGEPQIEDGFDYNAGLTPEVYNNDIEVQLVVQETQAVNSAPTISSIGNISKSESLTVGSTIATASASDADGDTLTYSLTVDQSSKLNIDNNGVITLASAFDDVATDTNYNVTVRAFDGTDDAKADFVLTVTADGSITIHENVLDFEDVHSGNDGTPIAYKQNVGYYTMDLYQGDTTNQKRIIENTGHTATNLTDVRTADLQNIDIMYVHNGDNSRYLSEWLTGVGMADSSSPSSASSDVWSWVNDGGILLIQDRHVTNANNMLLGESATITRSFGGYDHGIGGTNDDTDFRTELNDTLLYNGAAGTLTNNTLDGGGHTDHGHITNLGTGEVGIGHRGINDYPNGESYNNAFAYKYGSGLVYYDTYPMDLWDGSGVDSTYTSSSTLSSGGSQTYNENLIQWAASLYYDGASQINGTSGADTILGTMGDDVIYGGGAADTLWGGEGADTFKYEATTDSNTSTVDTILDFNASEDSIDISDITNSVTKVISGTQLQLDTNGDSTTDMYINLTGFTGTVADVTVVT